MENIPLVISLSGFSSSIPTRNESPNAFSENAKPTSPVILNKIPIQASNPFSINDFIKISGKGNDKEDAKATYTNNNIKGISKKSPECVLPKTNAFIPLFFNIITLEKNRVKNKHNNTMLKTLNNSVIFII